MNALQALNALNEIGKRCVIMEIDPEALEINVFKSHGGRTVLRARGIVRDVVITLDVYTD